MHVYCLVNVNDTPVSDEIPLLREDVVVVAISSGGDGAEYSLVFHATVVKLIYVHSHNKKN